MPSLRTPLIIGFITFESNEINMLKSIVRIARQARSEWRLICLNVPDAVPNQAEIDRHLQSLRTLCASLGGDFAFINDPTVPDFFKMQMFELDVQNYSLQRLLIDQTVRDLDKDQVIFKGAKWVGDTSADCVGCDIINIDSKPARLPVMTRLRRGIEQFFAGSVVDLAIGCLFGLFAILITVSLHFVFSHYWSNIDDTYIYLIFIIFANLCALQSGIRGGILCTLIISLGANYLFMEPTHHFKLNGFSDLVNWTTLVITSSVTSVIGALMVTQYRRSELKEKNLSLFLDINTSPLKHRDMRSILADLKNKLHQHLGTEVVFFVPGLINENNLETVFDEDSQHGNGPDLDFANRLWADLRQGSIHLYQNDPAASWAYLPLSTLSNDVGILALHKIPGRNVSQATLDYRTLSEMIAAILEYIKADQQSYARDILKEKDKLRTHILSSVSHDLKTPLASIIGSLGLYMSSHNKLKEQQIKVLVENAYAEANRLDGFVTNILTMTKLEAGLIKFRTEKIRPSQLVHGVLDKVRWRLLDSVDRVQVENIDFCELVTVDVSATELIIINLLDNALRHSVPDKPIILRFDKVDEKGFSLSIINQGRTIDPAEMDNIFDKYNRLQKIDSQQASTGLGLALSHGLMRGQNGAITLRNTEDGVAFVLTWPAGYTS
jgi:two-component system sensor histidine kinase KdpD